MTKSRNSQQIPFNDNFMFKSKLITNSIFNFHNEQNTVEYI
jgi:hypothetical protein